MQRAPFIWQDVAHWTGGDLMETLLLLGDQEEADDFLMAYADVCEDDDHALSNVAYICEIIATDSDSESAEEDANRIRMWFGIENTEPVSPRQWFKQSSLGVKVPVAA